MRQAGFLAEMGYRHQVGNGKIQIFDLILHDKESIFLIIEVKKNYPLLPTEKKLISIQCEQYASCGVPCDLVTGDTDLQEYVSTLRERFPQYFTDKI